MRNHWFDRWSARFIGEESSRTSLLGCHTAIGGKKLGKSKPDIEKLHAMLRDAAVFLIYFLSVLKKRKKDGEKRKIGENGGDRWGG